MQDICYYASRRLAINDITHGATRIILLKEAGIETGRIQHDVCRSTGQVVQDTTEMSPRKIISVISRRLVCHYDVGNVS